MRSLKVFEWCCAIRFNENEKVNLIDENSEIPFVVLKNSYRYWCADPFLYKKDNKYYVFFEMFDRLKRKGLLGYREVSKNGVGKIKKIFEYKCHLSYPYIYDDNGTTYIMPESGDASELFLLKCVSFPDKWVKEKVIYNEPVVDTTLFSIDGEKYYITQHLEEQKDFDRLDLLYEHDGKLFASKKNPMKRDSKTARGAGKVFRLNDDYIRPSQDCSEDYGKFLNFNKIISISKDSYSEQLIKKISIDEINIRDTGKFVGIHTYNKLDNVEVIDIKTADNFNVLNLIGGLIKRLRK